MPLDLSKRILILVILILPHFSACSTQQRLHYNPEVCSERTIERIYFGTATPQGAVSKTQWQEFLSNIVTPNFPAGLTVFEANGQWLGKDRNIVMESSYILELVHDNSPKEREAIDEIIYYYKRKFEQEAVMSWKANTSVCF